MNIYDVIFFFSSRPILLRTFNQYNIIYNYRIMMFIRVVLLIIINTNNSYITTLQQLSVCVFIETFSAKCQDTFYNSHPQSAVIINPSQDYTTLEVSLIETPMPTPLPCQHHLCLSTPPPCTPQFTTLILTPLLPPRPRSKSPATTKNSHSMCYLGNLITTLNIL